MINFFAPANNLGTGTHALNLARAMERLGWEICLVPPFGQVSIHTEQIDKWLANRARFSRDDPSLMIFDMPFGFQFCGTPRMMFAVFETDVIPAVSRACLASCDAVLVPSNWGCEMLKSHGIQNVHVVPEGIDPEIFPRILLRVCGANKFTFVHVGKFEERKGSLQVIRCFARALEGKEAILLMRIDNPFHDWEKPVTDLLSKLGFVTYDSERFRRLGIEIRISRAEEEPPVKLYAQADCGIFPSKGEGWGLPIHECISMGVPVITGKWTAMADYLAPDYPRALLLERPRKILAHDGIWFNGDRGEWYESEDEELESLILWAYQNAKLLRARGELEHVVSFARAFTWDAAARKLDEVIKLLCKK